MVCSLPPDVENRNELHKNVIWMNLISPLKVHCNKSMMSCILLWGQYTIVENKLGELLIQSQSVDSNFIIVLLESLSLFKRQDFVFNAMFWCLNQGSYWWGKGSHVSHWRRLPSPRGEFFQFHKGALMGTRKHATLAASSSLSGLYYFTLKEGHFSIKTTNLLIFSNKSPNFPKEKSQICKISSITT